MKNLTLLEIFFCTLAGTWLSMLIVTVWAWLWW